MGQPPVDGLEPEAQEAPQQTVAALDGGVGGHQHVATRPGVSWLLNRRWAPAATAREA
jgi:hypothetical protein